MAILEFRLTWLIRALLAIVALLVVSLARAGDFDPSPGSRPGPPFPKILMPYTAHINLVDGYASATDTTLTAVIPAQTGASRTYLTTIAVVNTTSSNTYVNIKDGSTVRFVLPVPANAGAIVHFPAPLRGSAATAWNFAAGAGFSGSTMYVSMAGYHD